MEEILPATTAMMYFFCVLLSLVLMANYFNPVRMGGAMGWTYVEGFLINRFTSVTRRIHLPRHRLSNEFTPSLCFMG
jgi:hypothetical protein